jgi:alkylation response protein AidB-like acyl-CoA dehydrogenase
VALLVSTADTLLARLPELAALARQHAADGERDRNLARPVVEAFTSAGLFRLCRPKAFGGIEAEPSTTLRVIEEIARGDGAAGWCVMVSGAGAMHEGYASLEGGAEMFNGPDVVVGGVPAPMGRAVPVDGGYRVSGRWAMASNCKQCHWLGAGCLVFDGDAPRRGPNGAPVAIMPVVAASDVKILDTWDVSGLRGTGSHDFEVTDVVVPARRCVPFPLEKSPHPGALYAMPFFGFQASAVASAALGVARAAIDEFSALARTKLLPGSRSTVATRASTQIALTQAEATLESARAWLFATIEETWRAAREGRSATAKERAKLRLAATNATHSAARAVDIVYTAGGSSSLYTKSPLQRCLRDVHAMTQHGSIAAPTYELTAKIFFDLESDAPLL